jgi:hypothetical protein
MGREKCLIVRQKRIKPCLLTNQILVKEKGGAESSNGLDCPSRGDPLPDNPDFPPSI